MSDVTLVRGSEVRDEMTKGRDQLYPTIPVTPFMNDLQCCY